MREERVLVELPDKRPTRQPSRIVGKDYSRNGAYFLTVCTKERHYLLGKVQDGEMHLSEIGIMVEEGLTKIEAIYPSVLLESYVVMPNHVHMLIVLLDDEQNPSVQTIVQQWKGAITKKAKFPLWQDRFHDRIILRADIYRKIRNYIQNNPALWKEDQFFETDLQGPSAQSS